MLPMPDEVARAEAAFERLSDEQRRLVGLCLREIVDGGYIPDWEFQTVMGHTRSEATAVPSTWPDPAGAPFTFRIVNNSLNSLLGYPHGRGTLLLWPLLASR